MKGSGRERFRRRTASLGWYESAGDGSRRDQVGVAGFSVNRPRRHHGLGWCPGRLRASERDRRGHPQPDRHGTLGQNVSGWDREGSQDLIVDRQAEVELLDDGHEVSDLVELGARCLLGATEVADEGGGVPASFDIGHEQRPQPDRHLLRHEHHHLTTFRRNPPRRRIRHWRRLGDLLGPPKKHRLPRRQSWSGADGCPH